MRLRTIGVLLLAALTAVAVAPAARNTGRQCMPVAVWMSDATWTYAVRTEGGSIGCRAARTVARHAAADGGYGLWKCVIGPDRRSWVFSCVKGGAIVRAYGPVREHDPWVIRAAHLHTGLLAPTFAAGLPLRGVQATGCGGAKEGVTAAEYGRPGGPTFEVLEERPRLCGSLGGPVTVAWWRVHGEPAWLSEFCAPTGCSRILGEYALQWRERGTEILVTTHRIGQRELLAIARGFRVVPA